jgi:hypothetical protein
MLIFNLSSKLNVFVRDLKERKKMKITICPLFLMILVARFHENDTSMYYGKKFFHFFLFLKTNAYTLR